MCRSGRARRCHWPAARGAHVGIPHQTLDPEERREFHFLHAEAGKARLRRLATAARRTRPTMTVQLGTDIATSTANSARPTASAWARK